MRYIPWVVAFLCLLACVATTERRGPSGEVEGTATTVYAPPGLGGAGVALDGALGGLGGSEVLRAGAGLLGVPDWLTEAVLALGAAGLGVVAHGQRRARNRVTEAYVATVDELGQGEDLGRVREVAARHQDRAGAREIVRRRIKKTPKS